jgi:hypothetical protein
VTKPQGRVREGAAVRRHSPARAVLDCAARSYARATQFCPIVVRRTGDRIHWVRAAMVDGTADMAATRGVEETHIGHAPTSPRGSGAAQPWRHGRRSPIRAACWRRSRRPARARPGKPFARRPSGRAPTERAPVGVCVPGTRLENRIGEGVEPATGADGGLAYARCRRSLARYPDSGGRARGWQVTSRDECRIRA